VGLVVELQQYK